MRHHNKNPKYYTKTKTSIIIVITVINTIALYILGSTPNATKQLKEFIEKTSPKRETPGKGLVTAALRPHKRETSRSLAHREKIYKIYPTEGL